MVIQFNVQQDAAVYGPFLLMLEKFKLKHGDQVAAATEHVLVIDASTIKAQAEDRIIVLQFLQHPDANIQYVPQVTEIVLELNVADV